MDQEFWDRKYRDGDRIWGNLPNPILTREMAEVTPGRALDVGCGEGADARWLADNGWTVVATDISPVALERAAALGDSDAIEWVKVDAVAEPFEPSSFDLVSLQYFPVFRSPDNRGVRALIDSVAPGGTLLVVGHALTGEKWDQFDPADFCQPHDFAELLGDDWTVDLDETRRRTNAPPEGSHHTHDTVMRAKRLR